jgi:pSer/pThr/pTyr-binding forkhead associated (FHA) protein
MPAVALDAVILRVTEGPASGSLLRVGSEEFLIGRQAPGAGKLGNDIEISRRHARVTRSADGSFVIEDLGSTNGTYVNGERIAGARVLQVGDNLEMGDTKLTVDAPPPLEDKVIQPTGAPPAVTTFAAIPEFAAEPAEPSAPAVDEPTGESAAPAPAEEAGAEAAAPAEAAEPEVAEPKAAEPEAAAPAEPEPEAPAEPEAAAPAEPEPEAAAPAEPEPEAAAPAAPEPHAEPAAPLLVASSGSMSVRVEGEPSGDLTVVLDDGESAAMFVRRGGTWTVQ